jgi:hypothetical protein
MPLRLLNRQPGHEGDCRNPQLSDQSLRRVNLTEERPLFGGASMAHPARQLARKPTMRRIDADR